MGNALRPLLLVLSLLLLGGVALSMQLWVHRSPVPGAAASATPDAASALATRHARLQHAFLILLGVSFTAVIIIALAPARRRPADAPSAAAARRDLAPVEHLARTTVAQGAALEQERIARHRSEQTLHLQQVLLNQSLEEKIRLGRDLHDGLIQSLYATGLALEAARARLPDDPARADALVARCIASLNTAIKDVRGEIERLSPARVRRGDFPSAVRAVLELLDADRATRFDVRLPAELACRIAADVQVELLQIIREAISNALRHGAATEVELRLETDGDRLCLGVQDHGRGFDPAALGHRGHGLDNLDARARAIGGELRLVSAPGRGTRLSVTFPASPPQTA